MPDFSMLFLGMAAFFGTHLIGVLPLGDRLRDILGRNAYRALHSLLSLAGLVLAITGYRNAPYEPVFWYPPAWAEYVPFLLMPFASMLAVGAYMGPEAKQIVRHPLLTGVALWSFSHLFANGTAPDIILFGSFLIFSLVMQPLADRKAARRDPDGWAGTKGRTSILPFAAILSGRADMPAKKITLSIVLYGLALFAVVAIVHAAILGVAVAPGFPG